MSAADRGDWLLSCAADVVSEAARERGYSETARLLSPDKHYYRFSRGEDGPHTIFQLHWIPSLETVAVMEWQGVTTSTTLNRVSEERGVPTKAYRFQARHAARFVLARREHDHGPG